LAASGRRDQISRLFQILFAMRAGHPNAGDLAALCEVSPRTIYRDLAALELAGVPIQYRTDSQGYQIAPSFSLPVPNLSRAEAASLLVASRTATEGAPFLDRENRSALGKILSALSPADRRAVEAIGRLLVPAPDGQQARFSASSSISSALFEALASGRRVHAWFEEGLEGDSALSLREETLGLYRLVRKQREWHILGALDREHEGVATITMGLGAIRRAELTNISFEMPDDAEVDRLLGMAGLGPPVPATGILVRIRALTRLARLLHGSVWHPTRSFAGSNGWQELTLVVGQVDPFLRTLIGLGEDVEVLAPLQLVARLKEMQCRPVAAQTASS
jgi:predicted DNA-binding transcriptional regulator YafY